MTETSRFWNGLVTGDAVLSPYEADTVFSEVMAQLSRTMGFTNRGAVINHPNATNFLTAQNVASPVLINSGYAFVYGTYYHNDAPVSFNVVSPSLSTRTDRIVLRKDWAGQTVRLVYIQGSPASGGGLITPLVQNPGTTWEMPICSFTVTTGGVITITDQRELSPPTGASIFIPWTGPGILPELHYNANPAGAVTLTLPSVPSNATAVAVSFRRNAGTFTTFELASTAAGDTRVFQAIDSSSDVYVYSPTIIIPIIAANPAQIVLNNAVAIDIFIRVIGWWVPTF